VARELVDAALAGDRSAWSGIWDLHGAKLHSYAWRLLGNDHDAQDAVADTFVSAAENLHQLRDPDQLRPWLYAICRRHVQRRWEQRDKVRPMDDMVAVVDAREPTMNVLGIDAAEATALLWEAADGLGQAERELLSLVLTADLDSGEVARVTGEKPDAVYVRISRLKDGLGRAAGALLVARHHREDCTELDALLRDWDGGYSTIWRKRIARHVDSCVVCSASHKAAAGALFGIAGLAPLLLLPALRDRCVGGVGSPEMVPVSFEAGWPVPEPWERKRRGALLLAAAAAVVLALIVLATTRAGTPDPSATSQTSTLPTEATTAAPVNTTATASPSPKPTEVRSATANPTTLPPVVKPSATPRPSSAAPTTAAPLPAAPHVTLALSDTAIQTSDGSTTKATATVSGTGTTTKITWNGTAPGSKTFPGSGSATIGPYSSVSSPSGTDTITVTATVTDAFGRKATATRTFTVSVTPQ
jgi:RNA polymerase sigma factor (sigma-70 family)